MASLLAHGIWLTLILGHSGVDGLDDIGSDGREEHLYNPNQFNPPPVSNSFLILHQQESFERIVPLGEGASHRWQSHRRTGC
jgi:hypothetical protein